MFLRTSRQPLTALMLLVFLWVLLWQLAPTEQKQGKVGAGLLLCSNGKVLLLQRRSKHNDKTWTVPGGNMEPSDSTLLGTATREAKEELGGVPPFEVKAHILTKRGKNNLEHFTVFVAEVPAGDAAGFQIKLSKESRAWRWIAWGDVLLAASGRMNDMDLHPVVAILASKHADAISNVVKSCPAMGGGGGATLEGND